jgi:hypothetical protein
VDVILRDRVVARRTAVSPFVGGQSSPSAVVVDTTGGVALRSPDGRREPLFSVSDIVRGGWSSSYQIPGSALDVGHYGLVWIETTVGMVTFTLDDWWPLRPADPDQSPLESSGFVTLFDLAGVAASKEAPPASLHEDILAAVVPTFNPTVIVRTPRQRAQGFAIMALGLNYVALIVTFPIVALIAPSPVSFAPWIIPMCVLGFLCALASAAPLPSWRRVPRRITAQASSAPAGTCPAWFRRHARIMARAGSLAVVDGVGVSSRVSCDEGREGPFALREFDVRRSKQRGRGTLVVWDSAGTPRLVLPLELWAPCPKTLTALKATLVTAGLTENRRRRRDVELPAPFDEEHGRGDGMAAGFGLGPWRVAPIFGSARLCVLASGMLLPFLFAIDLVDELAMKVAALMSAAALIASDVAVLPVAAWAVFGRPTRGGLLGVVRRWKEKRP